MCDTKGHDHWCSNCGKNLNKEPKDSYIEIEWSQNDKGQIVYEKSMICNECLSESENIKELDKFFSELKYSPLGHIFCSACKKDLTKELGKDIKYGEDYECLNFKCHERSGPNIKHIIKVVVLCKDCVKSEFNADNLTKLKKLGRNPKFTPVVTCDKIDVCKQYKPGGKEANCKNIVIGRDRETLDIAILCGRKHKGALPLPFDDGISITRPRKGKGAALANAPIVSAVPGLDPVQQYLKEIEKLFKKYKIGKFGATDDSRLLDIETRITNMERLLNTGDIVRIDHDPLRVCSLEGSSIGTSPDSRVVVQHVPTVIDGAQEKQGNKNK